MGLMDFFQTSVCKMNNSIALFLVADILPGFLLYLVLTGGSFIPAFLQMCCKHTRQARWTSSKAETIVEYIFGGVLKKHSNKEGKITYVFLDYKAPPVYTNMLFIVLIQLLGVAAVQFLDTFLLVEYNSCFTSGLTCCYNDSTPFDCSNSRYSENDNNTSVTCYRFVFSIGASFGSAFGVVTTSALFIVVICVVLLKLSNGSSGSKYRARSTIVVQVTAVLVIVAGAVIMSVLKSAVHYPNFVKIANVSIEIFAIAFIMIINVVLFPWYKFERLDDDKAKGDYTLVMKDNLSVL